MLFKILTPLFEHTYLVTQGSFVILSLSVSGWINSVIYFMWSFWPGEEPEVAQSQTWCKKWKKIHHYVFTRQSGELFWGDDDNMPFTEYIFKF